MKLKQAIMTPNTDNYIIIKKPPHVKAGRNNERSGHYRDFKCKWIGKSN